MYVRSCLYLEFVINMEADINQFLYSNCIVFEIAIIDRTKNEILIKDEVEERVVISITCTTSEILCRV